MVLRYGVFYRVWGGEAVAPLPPVKHVTLGDSDHFSRTGNI